ncbi:MAG: GntR family transcriptional regulator, partial [Mycobacterium sp.]
AHEYVRQAVRAAILDGTLAAGVRLVQSELADQLGVSTTPLREALRDLATEGLVVFDPHRGALVRALDLDEVREIYALRVLLEPEMVRRVIHQITEDHLEPAAELQRKMDEVTDVAAWVELNREFHEVLAEPGRDSRLANILNGLRDSAVAYVALSLKAKEKQAKETNAEHAELIEHYRNRDVDAAVALTIQHLESTLAAIEETHK